MGNRYPDAVALKDISTATVADALLEMYSRIGIPRRVHSDCGSQFTSEMMAAVNRLNQQQAHPIVLWEMA